MANSLGGINLADIAQRSIDALTPVLLPISEFSTDFSDEFNDPKSSITTRIPVNTTADDVSGGFTADDSDSLPVTITLDKELGKAIGFTQAELSKGGEDRIMRLFEPIIVSAVGLGVIREIIKLLTTAAFSSESTITAANFDADSVVDIATILDLADVPGFGRFGIMKPTYYNSLAKDDVIQRVDASGSNAALREHKVERISGFNIHQFNGFPTSGTTATENLEAFFGNRAALCIGGRFPHMTEAGMEVVDVENVIEPATGFPIQFQQFYVPKERKHYFAIATLFGVAVGNAGNLTRVVSA